MWADLEYMDWLAKAIIRNLTLTGLAFLPILWVFFLASLLCPVPAVALATSHLVRHVALVQVEAKARRVSLPQGLIGEAGIQKEELGLVQNAPASIQRF